MISINQNVQPVVITTPVNVQSNTSTSRILVQPELGPDMQMDVCGVFCRIWDGDMSIGDVNGDGVLETTFTDIQPPFHPTRDEALRALPLCCNPRPGSGEDLYLYLYKTDDLILRGNYIPLALVNNNRDDICEICKYGLVIWFAEPIAVYQSESFRFVVQNNNTATASYDTYTRVDISFICNIIDKAATLRLIQKLQEKKQAGVVV